MQSPGTRSLKMDPKSRSQTFQPHVGDEIHGLCCRYCGTRYSAWCREWRMLIDQMERENLLFGVWFECCIHCISQILSVKMPKEFSSLLDIWASDFQDLEKLRCSHGMFVKSHCTITELRNSLAQVDRFGYTWRSSWCFWRSRVLIKQCAGMLQSENTIPKHLWREFLEQFPEFRTVFSRLMRFFLLKCIQFFPRFNVLVSGPVTFWSKMIFASLSGHGCMQWRHAKALDASSSSADAEFPWRRNYENCPWANTLFFYLYGFESVCSYSEPICLHCYCTQMLCLPFWFDLVKDTQWECGILAPSRKAAVLVTGKALANWKMVVCWWSATLVCQHTLQHLGCCMQQTI